MEKRKKVISISLIVSLILIVTLGVTYAAYNTLISGTRNQVTITGDIYMNYIETNGINITNALPMSKNDALASDDNVFNFQIVGKNTSSKDIYYGISLVNGDEIAGKTRINPEDVNVYLTSDDNVLIDAIRYKSFDNTKIWVDTIPAGTNEEITKNYSLRIWIDENVVIGNDESDYTIEEWNNSYVSVKVNVDGNLESMNMPLALETDETYVENNKAYFIAKISNYLDVNQAGISLQSTDNMKLEISGTNSDVLFAYKDSEGGEDETPVESLSLEYDFTTNKTVEVQVFVIPKNDANGVSDINVKLVKNDVETHEVVKRVDVKGNNYCLNNGFNELVDCILVSEHQTDNVETAKTQIEDKGYPNLNDTAPSYTYVEQVTQNVNNAYTISSGKKYRLYTDYSFSETTGTFTLTGTNVTDALSDKYLNYYTCGAGTSCSTMYKILGTDEEFQRITLADVYTYKIASTIRSEVGLYATPDDYGTSYIYRGDVENNNVYFGGFYWKIIRMNGDGSIRMIYNGTISNATGNQTSINNTTYQYNSYYSDPTYVGFMYGEDFSIHTSNETTYTNIAPLTRYYFGSSYEFDEETETFELTGNITSGTVTEMKDKVTDYPYTCLNTNSISSCEVMIKVNSYISEISVRANYISYSSNSYENTLTNDNSSTIKTTLDNWYQTNIVGKSDSEGNLLTNYIVDGTFCNDRILASTTSGNGYSLVPTTIYSAYKRLNQDSEKTAALKCSQESDRFSMTSGRGNSQLTYPVALITADEVTLAGGKTGLKNEEYYLRTNGYFWTMTPSYFDATIARARVYYVSLEGELIPLDSVVSLRGLRPVINIRSDVLISQGDGTIENPFILKLS